MEATTAAKKITGKKLVLRYIGKTTEIVQVASDVLVTKDSIYIQGDIPKNIILYRRLLSWLKQKMLLKVLLNTRMHD